MKLKQLVLLSAMLLNCFLPIVAADNEEASREEVTTYEEAVIELGRLRQQVLSAVQTYRRNLSLSINLIGAINFLNDTQVGSILQDSGEMLRELQGQLGPLLTDIEQNERLIQETNRSIERLYSQFAALQQQSQPMDEDN